MNHFVHNIPIKKQFGQHFLRQQWVLDEMIASVELDSTTSVMEIGCGDGVLTRTILATSIARLWVFEIDYDWVEYINRTINDSRLRLYHENVLDSKLDILTMHAPWTLLANLPYQVTFPILFLLQQNRHLFREGVIMVQEEVAQKLLKKSGRGYGYTSLFFSYYFEWHQLSKIPPTAFLPPPKVNSRLLYFKPILYPQPIPNEENFWRYLKLCFKQPTRTLKNNLSQTHIDYNKLSERTLSLRARQLNFDDLLSIWQELLDAKSY